MGSVPLCANQKQINAYNCREWLNGCVISACPRSVPRRPRPRRPVGGDDDALRLPEHLGRREEPAATPRVPPTHVSVVERRHLGRARVVTLRRNSIGKLKPQLTFQLSLLELILK